MGREFELKYRANQMAQDAILQDFTGFRQIAMATTYFDTPSAALSAKKVTLRLRMENDVCVCTLKTPLADGSRGEWECHATDIREGLSQLVAMGAPEQIAALAEGGLVPVCGARFTRFAAQIATEDGDVELAVDRGVLIGGQRQVVLCEVEVESKDASDEATEAFAQALALRYGLQPEPKSKFRRAMDLAQGE